MQTVDRIRAQLPSIKASIPLGIDTTIVLDRTTTIRASVSDVERTLLISIGLVIVVVFVFLRNGRATLIPGVAVPVSLVGTFAVMYLFGYSIDNLSLMALTISTGFVVDDAIVVMENISRHLENGMKPFAAALKGAEEIGFTVFTISISLIAVFIPLLLMGGIVGRLFREFAVTLSTAIVVSMVISLTTTPMMCAYLLKDERDEKAWPHLSEPAKSSLTGCCRCIAAQPALGAGQSDPHAARSFSHHRAECGADHQDTQGFFPAGGHRSDRRGSARAAGFVLSGDERLHSQIGDVIKNDPAVANVIAFTGGDGATNTGFIYIALKPLAERKVSAAQIIDRLRPKLNRLPVASAFLQAVQDLRIGGRSSNAMYQYTIQSDNVQDLTKWGPIMLNEMKHLPGFQDVSSDQQNGGLDELLTYRSRHRGKARPYRAVAGLGPVRRIRPIGSVHHLHAVESVLRGAGSCSPVLAKPGGIERHLPVNRRLPGTRARLFRCSRWPRVKPIPRRWPSTIRACFPRSRCPSTSRRTCL